MITKISEAIARNDINNVYHNGVGGGVPSVKGIKERISKSNIGISKRNDNMFPKTISPLCCMQKVY
jgi:hypothetical protein